MISNQKELYDFIDQILKPYGFIKKKDTWYQQTDECICYLIISKSPFAGRYEELMGVFLKEMNLDGTFPGYELAHLKYSMGQLVNNRTTRHLFDLENATFKDKEREEMIEEIITTQAIPFIQKLGSRQGIIDAIHEHKNLIHYARTSLRENLQL